MSWYHSVKIAGNLSNKKLSSACDFIWVLQFFSISCRYFVEQLWSFSLNNSFKQKVKTKHSVHANVPKVIHIKIFFQKRKIKIRNRWVNIGKKKQYLNLINYRNSDNKSFYVRKLNGPKDIFIMIQRIWFRKSFWIFHESYSEH